MALAADRRDDVGMDQVGRSRVQPGDVRVGDADREGVVDHLKLAYARGRLDIDDFDRRLERALTARTAADLARLTDDLHPAARPAPGPPRPSPGVSAEERLLAGLAHGTAWVPVIILPALLMATAGSRSPYVRRHAAEAVNFQLTLLLVTVLTFGLGAILYAVAWAVGSVAAVLAVLGQDVRYPWTLRVVGRR